MTTLRYRYWTTNEITDAYIFLDHMSLSMNLMVVVDKIPPQAIGHHRSNLSQQTEREDAFQVKSTGVVPTYDP